MTIPKKVAPRRICLHRAFLALTFIFGLEDICGADEGISKALQGPAFGDQSKVERKSHARNQTNQQRQHLDLLAYEIFEPTVPGLTYMYFRVDSLALFKRFGVPKVTKSVLFRHSDPGPENPQFIETLTWEYPGMVMVVSAYPPSRNRDPEKVTIDRIEISSPEYNLQNGLKVGMSVEEFIAKLGNPNDRTDGRFSYIVEDWIEKSPPIHEVAAYDIELFFDDAGVVTKIAWEWGAL